MYHYQNFATFFRALIPILKIQKSPRLTQKEPQSICGSKKQPSASDMKSPEQQFGDNRHVICQTANIMTDKPHVTRQVTTDKSSLTAFM